MRRTTYGYNYLAIDDDVYLYTGMSSVTSDESNIGFVLVNLRTKDTKFYAVPGATELSAMESAQGQVQHLNYKAYLPASFEYIRQADLFHFAEGCGRTREDVCVCRCGTVPDCRYRADD